MGRLKMHADEHALLEELLAQRLFHPSRRGAWYQRKALERAYLEALANAPAQDVPSPESHFMVLETLHEIDAMLDGDLDDMFNAMAAEYQAEQLAALSDE